MKGFEREHLDGMLRGAIGSVAGLAMMGLYFRAAQAISNGSDRSGEEAGEQAGEQGREQGGEQGGDGRGGDPVERHEALDDISVVGQQSREDEPATESVGRIAYETVTGDEPEEDTRQKLGQAVHWGYGILMGGVYGALRPEADAPDLAAGLGYGTALWVLGDELMVPLLGLSEGPTAHSIPDHAMALGAHLAYGATTATATQALRRVM